MRATRKAATAGLRLWGMCILARYWQGPGPQAKKDARVIEALRAQPVNLKSEGSKDAFHRLTVDQIIKNTDEARQSALTGVPEKERAVIAHLARLGTKEGYEPGIRSGQPYSGSQKARDLFLVVDMELRGWMFDLAMWVYVAGNTVHSFKHEDIKDEARAKYRAHDELVERIMWALSPEKTIVDKWAEELAQRMGKWSWDSTGEMIGLMLLELDQMEERRVGPLAS